MDGDIKLMLLHVMMCVMLTQIFNISVTMKFISELFETIN